jgi:tRNA threonylcarbamoyladenosine biosynthesis protein TsaB
MNEDKPILAIETSGSLCSAALYFSDEIFFSSSINLKNSHSQKLFEIIEFLYNQAEVKKDQINFIAISGGPGSFTGLRIGMAAAKGIASGAGVPMVLVPTFEAIAFQLSFFTGDSNEFIVANKVNKDEVYYAKFKVKSNNYIFVDKLTILTIGDFVKKAVGVKVFGNAYYYISKDKDHQIISSPSAEYIAKWALKFGSEKLTYHYDFMEPYYLKNFIVKERHQK